MYEIVYDDDSTTYLSCCEYDKLSASAKALLYNSENLIIGGYNNSNKHIFEMMLPDIVNIYCHNLDMISDDSKDYYKKIGASTSSVKTPVNIFD